MTKAEQIITWLNFVPYKSPYQHPRVFFSPPKPKKKSLRYPGEPLAHHKFWKDYRTFRIAWRNIMESRETTPAPGQPRVGNQFSFSGHTLRLRSQFCPGIFPTDQDPKKFEWIFERRVSGSPDWELVCKIDIVPLIADSMRDPPRTSMASVLFARLVMYWVQSQ